MALVMFLWGLGSSSGALMSVAGGLFLVGFLQILVWLLRKIMSPYSSSSTLVVGADGILIRTQFVSYSKIRTVRHKFCRRIEHEERHPHDIWIVGLSLVGGEDIELNSFYVKPAAKDEEGAELARAIETARAAWVGASHAPDLDAHLLARGKRTGSEWLEALRGLGSIATYRSISMHAEDLLRVLDDTQANPTARAAAAVALAASGSAKSTSRLRIVASSMANPRMRVALEKIADGDDDDDLAEALEELEKLEAFEETPSPRKRER
jgi:hypothetical protein